MQKPGVLKIGLLINPIAGMGGKVGLHGTDDSLAERAKELGAKSISTERASRAISALLPQLEKFSFYAPSKSMGADLLQSLDVSHQIIYEASSLNTSSEDTKAAALAFQASEVDLILFAGGDGIAFISTEDLDLTDSELDYSQSHYFGSAKTFLAPSKITSPKVNSNASSDVALKELTRHLATEISKDRLYFFGPGRSAKLILNELGVTDLDHSLAGVDALFNGKLIGKDLDESEILELISSHSKVAGPLIFLGVIGGQGFLLGRGNQQLSHEVMSRIGAENAFVLASASKMTGTVPTRLYVDFEDALSEKLFPDFIQVHVAKNRTLVCKVVSSGLATTNVRAS